jgi:hypothetical protein
MSTVTVTLVPGNDGHIDQDATREAFNKALLVAVAEAETQEAEIASQVSAIFDQFHGKRIGMPALGSMVAQRLNAQPENFKTLSDRALDYVRANAGEGGLYVITKGKNGGCGRVADQPKPETK